MKKCLDIVVLFFLAIVTFVFSILIYVRFLWPNADFEQIMMTINDLTPKVFADNVYLKDYIWGMLFFVLSYPLFYFYFNTKQKFCTLVILLFSVLHFSGYIYYETYRRTTSTLYETEYVDPSSVDIKFPEKKRNLLLIYMESFENNFRYSNHYEKNLIPNLSKLQEDGQYSLAHESLPGSDYSIAALVASQCGVPLRFAEDRDIWATRYFLPNAVCFPEILRKNGYKNVFVKAADITFTKADVFAKAHGFDEALGVDEILPVLPNKNKEEYMGTFGGVTDRVLFGFAKKKLEEFKEDEPFMLSLFSLDTHTPVANLDKSCKAFFGDLRDSFICADKGVYEFIEWFKTTKYWDNTTVVVVGDHLLPSRIFYKGRPKRGIYNLFLNVADGLKIRNDKIFSTYDLAPTILESLGAKFEPRGFGLGRSMFSDEMSLIEKIGVSKLKIRLIQKSLIYDNLIKPKVERVDVYKDYVIGDIISEIDFLDYTDAYSTIMKQHFLDRLNLKLVNYDGGDLILKIKFIAITGGRIKIFANSNLIYEISSKQMIKQPVVFDLKVNKELVKDGKLQLIFKNTGGIKIESQMGISPRELKIEEIK